jgi:hypothetical protein
MIAMRTLAAAGLLLVGMSSAFAGSWADDVRLGREQNSPVILNSQDLAKYNGSFGALALIQDQMPTSTAGHNENVRRPGDPAQAKNPIDFSH